jgi:hypothetical protein
MFKAKLNLEMRRAPRVLAALIAAGIVVAPARADVMCSRTVNQYPPYANRAIAIRYSTNQACATLPTYRSSLAFPYTRIQ